MSAEDEKKSDEEIAEERRSMMRIALARRMKQDLLESEEERLTKIQAEQYSELDRKLRLVLPPCRPPAHSLHCILSCLHSLCHKLCIPCGICWLPCISLSALLLKVENLREENRHKEAQLQDAIQHQQELRFRNLQASIARDATEGQF